MMNGAAEVLNVPSPCCAPGVTPSELTACSSVIAGVLGELFIFPLESLCHPTVSPLRRLLFVHDLHNNKWMPMTDGISVIGRTIDFLVCQQATLQTVRYVIIYYYRRYVVLLTVLHLIFITNSYAYTYVTICVTASSTLH
jgi:hypothetical protein